MIRILLTILLPIALPLLLYLAYMKFVRPQHPPGATPGAAPGDTPGASEGADLATRQNQLPFWIMLGVFTLLLAGMLTLGLSRGVPPGTKLIAPHLEDGEIVPSQRLDQP